MIITINSKQETIDGENISVARLIEIKKIPSTGTAIAVNGRLCPKDKWNVKQLHDGDDIMLITAAYGG